MPIFKISSAINVAMRNTTKKTNGGVAAVLKSPLVAHTTPMKKASSYCYTVKESPGVNVFKLRTALGWSQRKLADQCNPAIDHTTVRRVENNIGYTQDTLERIAVALKVDVDSFFLPLELAEWPDLPEEVKKRIAQSVQDAVIANKYRNHE